MKKKQYTLDSIHCAGCTYQIENKILKINGVKTCSLNFISLKLNILFDETIIDEETLLKKLDRCIDSSSIINSKDLVLKDEDLLQENNDSLKLRKRLFSKR